MTPEALLERYAAQEDSLSGTALEQAGGRAWSYLVQQTMGRIEACGKDCEDRVFACFQELTDTIGKVQSQARLTRETVGDWTRTYGEPTASMEDTCREIIRRHLGETGLLYRGWPG